MIVDMVGHLLRQGKYNRERGIVVLCAYLCVVCFIAPLQLTAD
jgi:hypothetical protein